MMLASTVESASVCSRATEIRSCRWEWDRKRKRARLLRSLHPNRWLTISIRHFILRLVAPPSSSRPNRFFGDQFRLVFIPLFLSSFGCVVARAWVNCTLHGNLCAIYHLVRSAFHYDFSVLIFFSSSAVHYVFDFLRFILLLFCSICSSGVSRVRRTYLDYVKWPFSIRNSVINDKKELMHRIAENVRHNFRPSNPIHKSNCSMCSHFELYTLST